MTLGPVRVMEAGVVVMQCVEEVIIYFILKLVMVAISYSLAITLSVVPYSASP